MGEVWLFYFITELCLYSLLAWGYKTEISTASRVTELLEGAVDYICVCFNMVYSI